MVSSYHENFLSSRPSTAAVDDQTERAGQGPLIDAAQAAADAALALMPIGIEWGWPGDTDPPGGSWMIEDGRLLNQSDYPDLYAVLGVKFNTGGEGAGQFRIPDFRGRIRMGAGQGPLAASHATGERLGEEKHALVNTENGAHDHGGITDPDTHNHPLHSVVGGLSVGNGPDIQGGTASVFYSRVRDVNWSAYSATDSDTHTHVIESGGSGTPHNNMQPTLVGNMIIRAL